MLGSLSYEELLDLSEKLFSSSQNVRSIVNKYDDNLKDVLNFCDSLDSYVKFIESNVKLNKDADVVLKFMIDKNK